MASRSIAFVMAVAAVGTACSSNDDSGGAPSGAAGAPIAGNESGGRSPAVAVAGGPSSEGGSAGIADESPGGSSGVQEAAGAPNADAIPELNGCTAEDYVDRRAAGASREIEFGTMGLVFTPKCMTVAAGQTVRWSGSFTAHPLAPGNPARADAGSTNTPIFATSSGLSMDVTFALPGTFPYYCQLHSFGSGMGMAGVVHVTR